MSTKKKTIESAKDYLTKKDFFKAKKETDEKFDKIDEKFDKIDEKFLKVETALQNQALAIMGNSKDIRAIKDTMATKDDIQRVISVIEGYTKRTESHEHKAIINTHRITELEPKMEDHEKRISSLENSVFHK